MGARGRLGVGGSLLPSATAAIGRVCAPHILMGFVCHVRRGRRRRGGGGFKRPTRGGRRPKAELRMEVEAFRRRRDDLQHRWGLAEAQVRSLTSTISATSTAQQAGVQSHGSGKSGSQ